MNHLSITRKGTLAAEAAVASAARSRASRLQRGKSEGKSNPSRAVALAVTRRRNTESSLARGATNSVVPHCNLADFGAVLLRFGARDPNAHRQFPGLYEDTRSLLQGPGHDMDAGRCCGCCPLTKGVRTAYVADELAVLSRQARDYAPFHTAVIPQTRRCGT